MGSSIFVILALKTLWPRTILRHGRNTSPNLNLWIILMEWTHAYPEGGPKVQPGVTLDHIIVCSKTLHDLSNKGSKIFSSLLEVGISDTQTWAYFDLLSITSLFFKGKISFWAMPSTLRFLRNYYHKHLPVNIWFFWIIWGNFSPPHKDKAILRVLSISKEVLALTNTWFFAFSIHSMKFCLLQFSPFFACHFIKKLKRIKKGEKSCFFQWRVRFFVH